MRVEPIDLRRAARAAAAGLALFVAFSALPNVYLFDQQRLGDVRIYHTYSERVLDGKVPYRDFYFEYPPAALAVIVPPGAAAGSDESYAPYFKGLLLAVAAAMIAGIALTLTAVRASTRRLYGAMALVGVVPAVLGIVVYTRYDLWPAALTALAVVALVVGRLRLAAALLGVAIAAKIYPVSLLPVSLVWAWRRAGPRAARDVLLICAGVVAVLMLPFAALGFGGLGYSFYVQTTRALQIESLGASFLLAAHQLGLYGGTVRAGIANEVVGTVPQALSALQTVLQVVALLVVWVWFARGESTVQRLLTGSAASVAAFTAFGKVLSPQFMIWLVPLVPLVAGRAGLAASVLLLLALGLTQGWFPDHYANVVGFQAWGWLVLARDLVLIALFAVLAWSLRPHPASAARSERT